VDISASDIDTLYTPSRCSLRVHLLGRGEQAAAPGPFQQLLVRQGLRHEAGRATS
jgi:hypothetical protein